MNPAPVLSESEIRLEVERIFKKPHRSKLIALYGTGAATRFEWDGHAWEVVPTTCELDLRARLPVEVHEDRPRQVFLVDWTEDPLPLDVACRLAGGRLQFLAHNARLLALFGARMVDPAFESSALARLFLSGALAKPRSVSGLRVGLDDAFLRFLETRFELPESAVASPVALFRWTRERATQRPEDGPGFLASCEQDGIWRATRRDLLAWLDGRLGAPGVLAWRAFELGQTERTLQVAVLAQAAEQIRDPYVRGLFGGRLAGWLPTSAAEFRAAAAAFSDGTLFSSLLRLERRTPLLEAAEALASEPELLPVLEVSEWLPSGHGARERAFASALKDFVAEASTERFGRVTAALQMLRSHRLDGVLQSREQVERREMAVRLAAWLCTRRLRGTGPSHGAVWQAAADLAGQYAQEGGYVEWARQAVRPLGGDPALGPAVRALLASVEAELRNDDRRFAEAYVAWVQSGKPSAEVLPIEQVAARVIQPFLAPGQRKLLVVLMDGMSQAAAAQLLTWMSELPRWKRIAWRVPSYKGPLLLPPVLAVAPTLTELSRSAFFAGEADVRFGGQDTSKDVQRWAQNKVVRELSPEAPAALFLRKDVGVGDALFDELQAEISSENKLVAVVVNAIDEELKGSSQMAKDYSRQAPRPLELLLDAAEDAHRAVLLVADHGHVLADRSTRVTGKAGDGRDGGARWRVLSETEGPLPEEVVLPSTCWRPKGAARVAVLWDSTLHHQTPHHGEHGGLSLAEAVAPAILLAPDGLDRSTNDEALRPVELAQLEPSWWQLRVPMPAPAPAPVDAAARMTEGPGQMALLTIPRAAPAAVASTALDEPSLVASLRASRLFKDQVAGRPEAEIERALTALAVLVRAGDVLPSAEFARQCGVKPHQVSGVVARLGVLNADGFAIVEHDVAGKRVLLHRARLVQQYGVRE